MKAISNKVGTADSMIFNPSDYIDSYVVSPGDANAIAVPIPTGAKYAVFSATGNFYALFKNTSVLVATLPAISVADGTASMLNPAAVSVSGLTNFSIVAPAAVNVVIAWYNE